MASTRFICLIVPAQDVGTLVSAQRLLDIQFLWPIFRRVLGDSNCRCTQLPEFGFHIVNSPTKLIPALTGDFPFTLAAHADDKKRDPRTEQKCQPLHFYKHKVDSYVEFYKINRRVPPVKEAKSAP